MAELKTLELMDRMLRRHQDIPPAGTKRKISEPPTCPPLSSLAGYSANARRQLYVELSQAIIASTGELLRQADEVLAKQQQGAHEHLHMEKAT
jgi:hypothetical protein